MIISEGAVRMDGTSKHYVPLSYPACANFSVVQVLLQAVHQVGYRYHSGIYLYLGDLLSRPGTV